MRINPINEQAYTGSNRGYKYFNNYNEVSWVTLEVISAIAIF